VSFGDGQTSDAFAPVHVGMPGGVRIAEISTGCLHSLALTPKGEVLAWATISTVSRATTASPKAMSRSGSTCRAQLPAIGKVVQICGDCEHTLALTTKGAVLAWGDDAEGELGLASAKTVSRPALVTKLKGRGG
jgi:alpha-tubulin suppressor-like RCC1 family protein